MRRILLFVMVVAGWAGAQSIAVAAPAQLYGKSVVVSWSEEREQRVVGEDLIRHVTRNGEFSVYLSEAGRPFSRMNYSFAGGRGGLKSGSRDAVGAESGGGRKVDFSGNSLTASMMLGGGVRRILVSFDSGFQSCTAQVINGKEEGRGVIRGKSLISGKAIEKLSVKTGAASCRVRSGNVFGD